MNKKLPKKFKKNWIKALLSGDYKQGKNYLFKIDNNENSLHCCLGVAENICGTTNCEMEFRGLPEDLYDPKAPISNEIADKLAVFNDNGKSFKWIAAYIKRYL